MTTYAKFYEWHLAARGNWDTMVFIVSIMPGPMWAFIRAVRAAEE